MEIEKRLSKIQKISVQHEKVAAVRQLMDEFESGALHRANSAYIYVLGNMCLNDLPEMAIECYYLSMFLNSKAFREGREQAGHDVDVCIMNVLSMPGMSTPAMHKRIDELETKYGIRLFSNQK
ncbi:MAG: LysR family transcriptional regulator [Candidatus Obscuribacterales bacterium]|nr:LysR family transcriptional regulator [Candidatus Obscuribacterales bacterium]